MSAKQQEPVVIVAYDPSWPQSFAALRDVYRDALAGLYERIEHVGSTAVPGLAAKPIIDIDVVIPTWESFNIVKSRLESLGYHHQGDLGIAGREAFGSDSSAVPKAPKDGAMRTWPAHNLYVCSRESKALAEHLAFRDWLRNDPERVAEYGALKRRLAEVYRNDRVAYTEAKSLFIRRVLWKSMASPSDLAEVIVRPEEARDHDYVYLVNEAAFPTSAEAKLVGALREQARPILSLVAEERGAVVGHIMFSPVSLPGYSGPPMMGLGPMAVQPERQRSGIGSRLVLEGLDTCRELGAGAVVVLGHADFYPRFGFVPASRFGLASVYPVPDDVFMALELQPGSLSQASGTVAYHPAFREL